jgi:hypothetical protein
MLEDIRWSLIPDMDFDATGKLKDGVQQSRN